MEEGHESKPVLKKGKRSNQARFPVVSSPHRVGGLLTGSLRTAHRSYLLTDENRISALQARIKKLIQADEDVGKLAQGTPIVVCKLVCALMHTTHTRMHTGFTSADA